ncbi:sulfatase-like hydrolase/transferase [Kitasatospora purpeofusca]|uniref:sulfatase-like hydrolase/transferase n=1 Tax=Kitasatospora purpeofusca TaxID=67352 RepID=UPI00338F2111
MVGPGRSRTPAGPDGPAASPVRRARNGRPDVTAQRPNVLVVLTGQQTADAMGAAGNPHLATPHMDALAAVGTRYRRAYCGQPLCAPSRTGLLTGRLPGATGASRATGDGAASEPPLGRVFAEAGYDCVYAARSPRRRRPRGARRCPPTTPARRTRPGSPGSHSGPDRTPTPPPSGARTTGGATGTRTTP